MALTIRQLKLLISLAAAAAFVAPSDARAGFEWEPPPAQAQQGSSADAPPAPGMLPSPAGPEGGPDVLSAPLPVVEGQPLDEELPASMAAPALEPFPLKAPAAPLPPAPAIAMPPAAPMPVIESPRLAAPVSASPFAEVAGFGKNMPLALAMRQIVPAEYGFHFAQGVNPGLKIDWNGGKPWDTVLQEAVEPHGLNAVVSGRRVSIQPFAPGAVDAAYGAPQVSALSPSPLAPPVAAPPMVLTRPALDVAPMPAPLPAPAVPEARVEGEGGPVPGLYKPRNDKRLDEMLPPPVMSGLADKGPLPIMGGAEPAEEAPRGPESAWPPLGAMTLPPDPDRPALAPEQAASPDLASAPGEDMLPAMEVAAAPVPSLKSGAPDKPAVTYKPDEIRTWETDSGTTLREALVSWSEEAGVQLHWASQFDYPLQSAVTLRGTYAQAVDLVLSGLMDAQPRPLGRLHPNLPDGPAILVIETRHIIE